MSSNRTGIFIFDEFNADSPEVIYCHDKSPEGTIPDIYRAYRSMLEPQANYCGEAKDYDLWKAARAEYMASAIIAQSPSNFIPLASFPDDLDWVYIIRPKCGKGIRWQMELRAGAPDSLETLLNFTDRVDGGDIMNVVKRYPEQGRYTLRNNIVAIEVWDYQFRGVSSAKCSIRSGFLTVESAGKCARLRFEKSGEKVEVRIVDRLRGETVVATYEKVPVA